MPLIKIGDYGNGTIIDRDEWVAELNNLYGTWNGVNTVNDVHHKFSGANPGIIIDQLGAGLINDFRKSGLSICPIGNDGKIASPNVLVKKANWFFEMLANPFDGSGAGFTADASKYFIFPSGVNMRITKFGLAFRDVTVLGGGGLPAAADIRLQLMTPNFTLVGNGIRIGGSNLNPDTEYSESLDITVPSNRTATLANPVLNNAGVVHLSISVFMEWEQRLG